MCFPTMSTDAELMARCTRSCKEENKSGRGSIRGLFSHGNLEV